MLLDDLSGFGALFGGDDLTMSAVKKESKKTMAEVKKDNAKHLKENAEKAKKAAFSLPATCHYRDEDFVIEADPLGGTQTLSKTELAEKISDVIQIPAPLIGISPSGKDEVKVFISKCGKAPSDMEGWTVIADGFSMPAPKGSPEDALKVWCEQYPEFEGGSFSFDEKSKTAVVIPKADADSDKVTYPCFYHFFGGREYEYTPDDGAEEGTVQDLLVALGKLYKNTFSVHAAENGYLVFARDFSGVSAKKEPKVKKFPTDATLSLMLRHIELTPDMFAGKKEVTEDELINWLQPQYPEYSKERTYVDYDEKQKLIICHLKGASKGGVRVMSTDEEANKASSDEYALFFIRRNGSVFRNEKTPQGFFG